MIKIHTIIVVTVFLTLPTRLFSDAVTIKKVENSSVIVGSNNTIMKNEIKLSESGVELYLHPTNNRSEIENVFRYESGGPCLEYRETFINNNLTFFPRIFCYGFRSDNNDYIKSYFTNANVLSQDEMAFMDIFPKLAGLPIVEARVVNNTSRTISLKKIVFDVLESKTYSKPFVILIDDDVGSPGYIYFVNEGNTSIDYIEIKYSVTNNKNKLVNPPYKYYQKVNTPVGHSDRYIFDLKDTLIKEGVDLDYLRTRDWINETNIHEIERSKIKQSLGSFSDEEVYIHGVFKVCGKYNFNETCKSNKFKANIDLTPYLHALGAIPVSELASDIKLKGSGKNYPITVNLSSFIKPYSVEKYLFRLDSESIGNHIFKVKLVLSNNKIITSKPINLFLYKPKSMQQRKINWGNEQKTLYSRDDNLFVTNVKSDDSLNIRATDGITGQIIGKIPYNGKGIEFINGYTNIKGGETWIYIRYKDTYGWVNSRYIRE